jgi:hypothetical protein
MPISSQHKIGLLCDILKNQADEAYMTQDEATQIERLLQSLSNDPSLNEEIKEILVEMSQHHEINHKPFQEQNVEQWLNVMDHATFDTNELDSPGNNYK